MSEQRRDNPATGQSITERPCLLLDDGQEANARLIAAAPDMLEELHGLAIELQSFIDCGTTKFTEDWLRENLDSIKAVIARAGGQNA